MNEPVTTIPRVARPDEVVADLRSSRYGLPAPRDDPPATSDPTNGIRPGAQLLRFVPMRWPATPKSMLTRAGTEKTVRAVMNWRSAGYRALLGSSMAPLAMKTGRIFSWAVPIIAQKTGHILRESNSI